MFTQKMLASLTTFTLLTILTQETRNSSPHRSFIIDYPNNQFLKDGHPFRYISGSIHYLRVPRVHWPDRLRKMRASGLNAIQFYVPWNLHEPFPGTYNFRGGANLTRFLDLAQEFGFVVILRAGPYVCGDFDNGGVPWWLMKSENIRMRTSDPKFIKPVKRWYEYLLPILVPYLYKNGGPIAMMQIENEYGSHPWCDIAYTTFLRDLFRKYVGYDFLLITTDGGSLGYLKCGYIPDVYPTVDFGVGSKKEIAAAFAAQRTYAPRGPLVNSEFYPGWQDYWGSNFTTVATGDIIQSMTWMYQMNASFNFYMFEGGTNFGYSNDAIVHSGHNLMQPATTTYDYNAPLTEAGDPTPKLFAIQRTIMELTRRKLPPLPPPTKKGKYGKVLLQCLGSIIDLLDVVSPKSARVRNIQPLSMEQLSFPYGFVLYSTTIKKSGLVLYATTKDRGYVMLDGEYKGTLIYQFRNIKQRSLQLNATSGQKLQILIENQGREGSGVGDRKGLLPNVYLDHEIVLDWEMLPISFENIFLMKHRKNSIRSARKLLDSLGNTTFIPSVYYGKFAISHEPMDTYFDPMGWSKGQFFVNGNNVGRYWPSMGPQVTLYTPKSMLQRWNQVALLELEYPGNCLSSQNVSCAVSFTDKPYLNKTVPKW